jgi:azurin
MKFRFLFPSLIAAFISFGCGQKDAGSTGAAGAANSGPRVIEITAGDNMKFSVTTLEAKPGEELKVVLTNTGTQPKEVMGHNWILLRKGVDVAAFDAAAVQAKATDYVPASMSDQIIAHTALVGPRKSEEASFKAPTEPGDYPFLCSFPGHYQVGMKGTLTVR